MRIGKVLTVLLREGSPEVSWGLYKRKERIFRCRHLNISEATKLPNFSELYVFLVTAAKGANNYFGGL